MRTAILACFLLTVAGAQAAPGRDEGEFSSASPAVVLGSVTVASQTGLVVALGGSDPFDLVGNGTGTITTVAVHVTETPLGDAALEPTVEERRRSVTRVHVEPREGFKLALVADASLVTGPVDAILRIAPRGNATSFVFGGSERWGYEASASAEALWFDRADAFVSGEATVFVTGARVRFGDGEVVEATTRRSTTAAAVAHEEYTYVTLAFSDLRSNLQGVGVAFDEPRIHVAGTVVIPNATGRMVAGGSTYVATEETVRIEGDVDLTFARGESGLPAVLTFGIRRDYDVAGTFMSFRLGDGAWIRTTQPFVATVVAIGILSVMAALYTRLTRALVSSSATRRLLLEAVGSAPGIHLRALQRRTGLGWGRFHYHLGVLRRSGLVLLERDVNHVRVRLPGVPRPAGQELDARGRARDVHAALRLRGPATQREIRDALGLSAALVSHHVRALERDGVVVRLPGWPPRFALATSRPERGSRAGPTRS